MSAGNLLHCFFLLCLFGIAFTWTPNYEILQTKCKELTQLSQEEFELVNSTMPLETDNRKIKCFLRCIMTELDLMDPTGELTLYNAEDKDIKYKEHFRACKKTIGSDPCDKALNFQNCLWDQYQLHKDDPQ